MINYTIKNWIVERLNKGSGKARWNIIAFNLNEYQAKSLARDANDGSKTWKYRARCGLKTI